MMIPLMRGSEVQFSAMAWVNWLDLTSHTTLALVDPEVAIVGTLLWSG